MKSPKKPRRKTAKAADLAEEARRAGFTLEQWQRSREIDAMVSAALTKAIRRRWSRQPKSQRQDQARQPE